MNTPTSPNTSPQRPGPSRGRRQGFSQRFGVQLPVVLIVAAFVAAAGTFLFREIGANRLPVTAGGKSIYFRSSSAEGIVFGTPLHCQGLPVGRVKHVEVAAPSDEATRGKITFHIEAELDGPYTNWGFKKYAIVRVGLLRIDYLPHTTIELQFDTILGHSDGPPQTLELTVAQDETGNMQDDLSLVLSSLANNHDEVEQRILSGQATALEKTLWNSAESAEKIRLAISELTDDTDGPSTVKQFQLSVEKLSRVVDDLGIQVQQLTGESTELVGLSKEAVEKLNATVQRLEKSSLDVLGETPAQRRAVRSEIVSTLDNLQSASAALKDLVLRVGDTGMGRMLIRKKPPEDRPAQQRR